MVKALLSGLNSIKNKNKEPRVKKFSLFIVAYKMNPTHVDITNKMIYNIRKYRSGSLQNNFWEDYEMINKKCLESMGYLIEPGDYDIKLAVCNKELSRYLGKNYSDLEEKWLELFRNTIGKKICQDSKNEYFVKCITDEKRDTFYAIGNRITEVCNEYIIKSDVLRVDIIKCPYENNKRRSFIIIKNYR